MLEIIRPGASAARARVALFDFDGTLSLIRSGWVDVMVPMMVEILAGLNTGETDAELRALVEDFVWWLLSQRRQWRADHPDACRLVKRRRCDDVADALCKGCWFRRSEHISEHELGVGEMADDRSAPSGSA